MEKFLGEPLDNRELLSSSEMDVSQRTVLWDEVVTATMGAVVVSLGREGERNGMGAIIDIHRWVMMSGRT